MTLPLPSGVRVRVMLSEGDAAPRFLASIARLPDGRTAWEWSPASLASGDDAGINVVKRQAPLIPGVHVVGRRELEGLPGALFDSLPDAWGRLLTDRALRKRGVLSAQLHGIDRLAVVGDRGPGALSFVPDFPLGDDSSAALDLDWLATEAELLLDGNRAAPEALAELARVGGSAGGSRPKAWIAVNDVGYLRAGASTLRPGETGWLVKFRAPRADPEDIGRLEYAYAKMASAAGVDVPEPWLIETTRGAYFASKRFDRAGERRVHVLTAAGLLDVAIEQALAADYGDLLRLVRVVTRSETEVLAAFRLAVFNVLAHNRDDHLRQFAFMREGGIWRRAPAYDLTFSEGPGGEHTLLVAGEGRRPSRSHLEALGSKAGIKEGAVRAVLEGVTGAIARWEAFAKDVDVSASSRRRVRSALKALA